MKKIGLLGCGAVASYGHVPAILEVPALKLCSLFDPNPENLKRMQEKYGIPQAFTDSEAFFQSGIEAVSITSPAPAHKANVLDAARHGLPVMCEKPLAMDRAEGEEMIAAMDRAGLTLFTGFCYRFSPCALKIRELVRAKAIGEARSLRLIYNWHLHGKYELDASGQRVLQKRRELRMAEGGPMVDCGTHQIDLAVFWLGSPVKRYQGVGAWIDDYQAPDHMWLHLDHASGAHTLVEISYAYHHTTKNKRAEFIYEIIGTEGVIRYDREAESFSVETAAGRQDLEFHHEKNFTGMYEEWARALETGRSELLAGGEESLRVVEISREATNDAIRRRL